MPERSTNAGSEPPGLGLAAEPHRRGRHEKQPSNGIAASQQPDHHDHHSRRVEETQRDHDESIRQPKGPRQDVMVGMPRRAAWDDTEQRAEQPGHALPRYCVEARLIARPARGARRRSSEARAGFRIVGVHVALVALDEGIRRLGGWRSPPDTSQVPELARRPRVLHPRVPTMTRRTSKMPQPRYVTGWARYAERLQPRCGRTPQRGSSR